jgi:hypothetical protein
MNCGACLCNHQVPHLRTARRNGEGYPHPWNESKARVEKAERSEGLHKRSAEDWGYRLRRAKRAEPLNEIGSLIGEQSAHDL